MLLNAQKSSLVGPSNLFSYQCPRIWPPCLPNYIKTSFDIFLPKIKNCYAGIVARDGWLSILLLRTIKLKIQNIEAAESEALLAAFYIAWSQYC